MPSEHRLHIYSILFAFLTQIRLFIVPGVFVLLGVGFPGNDWWEPWMMLFIIPSALFSMLRYVTYRYLYDGSELVIRTGLLFRRERHIPYARIQNIDAVQNVLHRFLEVVEVKIDTGRGGAAEATMSVLPMSALHEMRDRVFADRRSADASDAAAGVEESPAARGAVAVPAAVADAGPLLRLDLRELMLCGFIENRGAVLIVAAVGVVWELGVFDRLAAPFWGGPNLSRGGIRTLVRSVLDAAVTFEGIALAVTALVALLVFIRLLSMAWAVVRLHGFTLRLVDGDARSEFGLFTRVATTIPLRRVQSLTVRESPWHRRFARVAVRVDTAGGRTDDNGGQAERESLAPILGREGLDQFVRAIVGTGLDCVRWNPPAPGAFRREVKRWLGLAAVMALVPVYWAGWAGLLAAPLLVGWAIVAARATIRHLGWAVTDDAVVLRYGWLWRRIVLVRFAKIQVVTTRESPFDRRTRMAAIHVDTSGASAGNAFVIPYLARAAADTLHARLAAVAARTDFRF